MRDFKFRALDIAKNEVLEVESISGVYVTVSPKNNDDEGNYSYELEHSLFDDGSGKVEAIIIQYVGKKDKNDIEIYDGDIVELSIPIDNDTRNNKILIKEVRYSNEIASFILGDEHRFTALQDIKVIGNRYKNKELLEK